MLDFLKLDYNSNIKKFYIESYLNALWFPGPVWILYFLAAGLNLEQVGLLLGVLFITQFIFEIPSSIWADRYSRRNVLILGAIFGFIANVILLLFDNFLAFILAVIFMGVSESFKSGTDSAMVYDTLINLGREKDYSKIRSKIKGIFYLGRATVSVLGVMAYAVGHRLPFLLAAIVDVAAIFVLLLIKEPVYHKSSGVHLGQIGQGLKYLMANRGIWLIVLVFSLMLAASNVLFNNYQPVLDLAGVPILYFGLVYLGVNLFSFSGTRSYVRFERVLSPNRLLVCFLLVTILVSFAFAVGNIFLVVPAIMLLSFSFGMHGVYIEGKINQVVPSSHRATTLSIQGLIEMVMVSILIMAAGKIANGYGMAPAMLFNGAIVILALAGFLAAKVWGAGKGKPESVF